MAESYDKHAETAIAKEVDEGENIKEGLMAFKEARTQARSIPKPAAYVPPCTLQKRKPRWKNPRSLTVPAKL